MGGGGASSVHGNGPTQKAMGVRVGACVKHVVNALDAGRVPAQRLVEIRQLSSRKEGVGDEVGPGGVRAWAVMSRKRRARGGPDSRWGPVQGTREAHRKHFAHNCDTGCVPAQRLVELMSALPS